MSVRDVIKGRITHKGEKCLGGLKGNTTSEEGN